MLLSKSFGFGRINYNCTEKAISVGWNNVGYLSIRGKTQSIMNSGKELQRDVFNQPDKQYQQELIINPPPHTASETQIVINRLKACTDPGAGTIADFGSGTGRLTIPLLQNGYTVLPIDVSDDSLQKLKALAARLGLPLDQMSESLPQNGQCAAVVGADILHHVPLNDFLPVIYKSLRPGGCIIFSEPGAFNPTWYLFVTLFVGWKAEKRLVTTNMPNLNAKLARHGFRNIRITGLGLMPRPIFNRVLQLSPLNDRLGNLPILKLFAYRYIIEATR